MDQNYSNGLNDFSKKKTSPEHFIEWMPSLSYYYNEPKEPSKSVPQISQQMSEKFSIPVN